MVALTIVFLTSFALFASIAFLALLDVMFNKPTHLAQRRSVANREKIVQMQDNLQIQLATANANDLKLSA